MPPTAGLFRRLGSGFLAWGLTLLGFLLFFQIFAWLTGDRSDGEGRAYTPAEVAAAVEARRAAFPPGEPPVLSRNAPAPEYAAAAAWQERHAWSGPAAGDVAAAAGVAGDARRSPEARRAAAERAVEAGELPAWYPRRESAVVAPLVADGTLPPVDVRVGPAPVVMTGIDGPGEYGGTWLAVASSLDDVNGIMTRMGFPAFLRSSPHGDPLVPNLAAGVDASDDLRTFTLHFRRGVRWSDGHPLTTADYLYWWTDYSHHPAFFGDQPAIPDYLRAQGVPAVITAVDDYTLRFEFAAPYPLFPRHLARYPSPVFPKHFLEQYHPDTADPAFLEKQKRRWGLGSDRALWGFVQSWKNPEYPRLSPWILRAPATTPPVTFERNPYYFAVDPEGRQLPYIDRVHVSVVDQKMIPVSLAGGAASWQMRHLRFTNYTEVMTRRAAAGQTVRHWYNAGRSEWMINPNLNRLTADGDAVAAWKADLLGRKEFRQALSLAIDRKAVIDAEYLGVVEAAQLAPGRQSPYHHEGLLKAFVEHDPARAHALLDQCWRDAGADPARRDAEGFRTAPSGERLTFYLDYNDVVGEGPAPFVVDDWNRVGVRTVPRLRTRSLYSMEMNTGDFDFQVWWGESEHDPHVYARSFIAYNYDSQFAGAWGRWRGLGGLYAPPGRVFPANAYAVPDGHPMRRAMLEYEDAIHATDPAAARRHLDAMLDIAAEQVWTINLADAPPQLVVARADMRNVPDNVLCSYFMFTPTNANPETFWFERPDTTPGAVAAAAAALRAPTPIPGYAPRAAGRGAVGWLVLALAWGVPLLLVALLCLRHPFVLRRLALMVPTLLVVSVCVFWIIQLPPGDFLTTRIVALQQEGADPVLIEQRIDDLKAMFHYDEPGWKRYLRWVGLHWFATFDPADAGLLQGNLGRSMETEQSVNLMVGDTVTLTVAVSFATILFTWIVALPIGVYSAVRQYTIPDYIITVVGFLGMCVPAFLLALVLMVWSNATGLFSPQFAAQPEWDWPKALDLLKHIWIPVLVLGVGGTAGMIRVMRANLLDELRKPYVTTARAKGMRPLRLLVKYPVRLALNPFISGIGGLFPALVSGGTIVAMVLALPMVGPLMLNALFAQDMNFAGSMLVVLSLLGIVGTLVSDLLLLWADPRIRLEGPSR